ncbi:hypothetical protein [Clostridium botulinum]|uniref:hypothetical protein n=1 Tax=Clostridium botulinum TaxID=1491 RepID=UPI0019673194|nr:hypothetical protein [Clostridium botulinum]MBN1065458.1 hypothetical protein [Clostridium botulinum]
MFKFFKQNHLLVLLVFILIVSIFCFEINNNSKMTNEKAESVISSYLMALSNKDKSAMKETATKNYTKSLDDDGIELLKNTLKSAKLLNSNLINYYKNTALVDAEVEIICYADATSIGDWIPGKSISVKNFKLKKENGKWKVDDWGV